MIQQETTIDKEALELFSKEFFIIVSDNAFIHIGKPKKIECPFLGEVIRIFDSYTIRRWGTDNGIGQLCIEGKQIETRLDYNGITDIKKDRINHILHIKKTALETYGFR